MNHSQAPFVGFGFGAIQSGLFLYEAYRADPGRKLYVAEVVPEVVSAVRAAGGVCTVNIAQSDRIENARIEGITIGNPHEVDDRQRLIDAIAEASEISTAVPSVAFYSSENPGSLDRILAQGLIRKVETGGPPAIVYTAENHNHAAEILEELVLAQIPMCYHELLRSRVQFLNTVIGKMSQVVTDQAFIEENGLVRVTPQLPRAFLVEAFNRILITRIDLGKPFQRGIQVFEEKADLLPFEEAKLYGHNATHALIGYLGAMLGVNYVAVIPQESGILTYARAAFLEESGGALMRKFEHSDPLFTPEGYRSYAENLLIRMTNPFLKDAIERVTRDSERKLSWNDRLIGTMRLALSQGIQPQRYALGAAAALTTIDPAVLLKAERIAEILERIWMEVPASEKEKQVIIALIGEAVGRLKNWKDNGFPALDPRM